MMAMIASLSGPAEWVFSIFMIALILLMIAMMWGMRQDVPTSPDLTVSDVMFRLAIEGQLLTRGVPAERAADEARDLFDRHRESPVTDESFAAMHDDIVRTAGAWA